LPAYFGQYGGATLSTSVNKYFYTVLTRRSDGRIQVISSDLRSLENWEDISRMDVKGSGLEIPLAALKDMGAKISVNLFMASEIPPGTGLGSSATVCVNILKSLSTYLKVPMSKHKLAEKAYRIGREVLGKPVGKQDEYAAAFGGLNYISYHRDGSVNVEPLHLEPEVMQELQSNLMLFFTGAAHDSWNILERQEHLTRESRGETVEALHAIRQLAEELRSMLLAGDLHGFGELLDRGWQAKKRISEQISTPRIDSLYDSAKRAGALGGKITGAGGGGFLLLYCKRSSQADVRQALAKYQVREMTFEFDFQGAHVITDDPFLDGDERCGLRWTFVPNTGQDQAMRSPRSDTRDL